MSNVYLCRRAGLKEQCEVLNCNSFMDKLPEHYWRALMKLMQHAEYCFEAIVNNEVISHLYHVKQVVQFKRMNMPFCSHEFPLKYFGELAFWL